MHAAASDLAAAGTAAVVSADDSAWREFVLAHPEALPYHHPAWIATLAETYGYEPFAVAVRSDGGKILGGLPFVSVGGRLRPRRWIALPFTDACPPLTSSGLSDRAVGLAIARLQPEHEVASVEIRAALSGFETGAELRGVVHTLRLTDADSVFGAFPSRVRRNIRKAQATGLAVRPAKEPDDLTRVYFGLHADTRRRLGVPSQPRRFFETLWRRVIEPGLGFALLAYHDEVAVAGAVFLRWNGRIVYKYSASDRRHWPLRPNNLLLWECIRHGCATGAHTLDFGRSDLEDAGLRSFKRSWGTREEPLVYTTLGRRGTTNAATAGKLLRPVIRASPTWVSRALGAALYRLAA